MKKTPGLILSIFVTLFLGVFVFPLDGVSQSREVEQCPSPSEDLSLTPEAEAIRENGERVGTFRKSGACYGLYRDKQGTIHRVCETPGKCGDVAPMKCDSIDAEDCGANLHLVNEAE